MKLIDYATLPIDASTGKIEGTGPTGWTTSIASGDTPGCRADSAGKGAHAVPAVGAS